jgi:hypothetical protein
MLLSTFQELNILYVLRYIIQDDQKVSVRLMIIVQKHGQRWPSFGMWTCYTENTFRRVNKSLESGGGHFEHYL